jgi:DNA helicase-2/ATP-dependent DNA helicase PcrA
MKLGNSLPSSSLKEYFTEFNKVSILEHYRNVLNKSNLLKYSKKEISVNKIEYLCKYSQEILKKNKIELEDYAALAYLKYRIYGFEKKIKVNNVVMDEAQDYSLFQFYVLKEILNTNMFTILGDVAQGIHAYRGISDWNKVIEDVFKEEETSYKTLVQSYRTTIEVMDFANQIIKNINNLDERKKIISKFFYSEYKNKIKKPQENPVVLFLIFIFIKDFFLTFLLSFSQI